MIIDLMPAFITFLVILLALASIIAIFSKTWRIRRAAIIATPCLIVLGWLVIFGVPRIDNTTGNAVLATNGINLNDSNLVQVGRLDAMPANKTIVYRGNEIIINMRLPPSGAVVIDSQIKFTDGHMENLKVSTPCCLNDSSSYEAASMTKHDSPKIGLYLKDDVLYVVVPAV
jgi:hypothetical protein